MYDIHIKTDRSYYLFEKIMFHPDCTKTDYNFISVKIYQRLKIIAGTEVCVLGGLMYVYYKTKLGEYMRRNILAGGLIFALTPFMTLQMMMLGSKYQVDWKLDSMGLKSKYQI